MCRCDVKYQISNQIDIPSKSVVLGLFQNRLKLRSNLEPSLVNSKACTMLSMKVTLEMCMKNPHQVDQKVCLVLWQW